jgi:hypothetical protein
VPAPQAVHGAHAAASGVALNVPAAQAEQAWSWLAVPADDTYRPGAHGV